MYTAACSLHSYANTSGGNPIVRESDLFLEQSRPQFGPTMHQAACCPLPLTQEHWFTVRCLWGEWWNLNSLFPAPQPLGQFYLSAFLASLQEQGYQILVVRSR